MGSAQAAVEVLGLDFGYTPQGPRVLHGVSLRVEPGSRCLLVGSSEAGKSTLLAILAGQHRVAAERVRVLGNPAFPLHPDLVGQLGGEPPAATDQSVAELLAQRPAADAERLEDLCDLLGVDRRWNLRHISAKQRRRVGLLLQLLAPRRLWLVDEVTAELDLVTRADLLRFLRRERGTTVIYATQILDGLDDWVTHLALLDRGRLRLMTPLDAIPELRDLKEAQVTAPLHRLVERWLRDC